MGRPHSELDIVFLIGQHWDEITSETPLEEIEFHDGHFDATGIFDGREVMIEVEQEGSDFFQHGHNHKECDLVIVGKTIARHKESVAWSRESGNPVQTTPILPLRISVSTFWN
jgi:hypothetical protein